jgi:hypothetical protein
MVDDPMMSACRRSQRLDPAAVIDQMLQSRWIERFARQMPT